MDHLSPPDEMSDDPLALSRRALLGSTAGIAGLAALGLPVSAGNHGRGRGGAGAQGIDSCTEITEPGRYVLTRDIDASGHGVCLTISADDVVLDGAGHTIDGGGAAGMGVAIGEYLGPGADDVVVRNLGVTGFTEVGIDIGGSTGGQVRNVQVSECRIGLRFQESRDIRVTGSRITDSGNNGVVVTEASFGNTFRDNVVANNDGSGIALFDESSDSRLRGNVVTGNARTGIVVAERSNDCALARNVSEDNGGHGFDLDEVSNCRVIGNDSLGNGGNGFVLLAATENRLIRNEARENDGHGIALLRSSDDNRLIRNELCDNGGDPIFDDGTSSGNTLRANVTDC